MNKLAFIITIILAVSVRAETFTPQQFGGKPGEDATESLQECFEAAVAARGEVYLSPGVWRGNVAISNVQGITIRGDSRLGTTMRGIKPNTPALRIEGFWYSRIADLEFGVEQQLESCGVLEIDSGRERGVQANTFERLLVNAQGVHDGKRSKYAMSMCRVGGNSAQGDTQLFLNCHFSGAKDACYYQLGYNALTNIFIGGNFQSYDRCGIELVFGSLHVYGVAFQSTEGWKQISNDGWDIKADSGGVNDALIIDGCRTESLRFFKGCYPQPAILRSCRQGIGDHYLDQIAGRPFTVVELPMGSIENCYWDKGSVIHYVDTNNLGAEVSGNYTCKQTDRWVLASSKTDNQITLCDAGTVPAGHMITIVRAGGTIDSTWGGPGETFVSSPYIDNVPVHSVRVTDSAQFIALGGGVANRRWYRVK